MPSTSIQRSFSRPCEICEAVTVPSAVRLGTRADPPARQSDLARSIGRQHLVCIAGIAAVLALQLAAA